MKVSDCCGAAANSNGDSSTEDYGICPECKEHCEYIDVDSEENDMTAEQFFNGLFNMDFMTEEERQTIYKGAELFAKGKLHQASLTPCGWVKAEEDMPPDCTVVLGYNEKWIDEDFEPEGIRECFYSEAMESWNSAKWNNDQDTWFNDDETAPTHWMQRPNKPNL